MNHFSLKSAFKGKYRLKNVIVPFSFLFLVGLYYFSSPESEKTASQDQLPAADVQTETTPDVPEEKEYYQVSQVVDGDTLKVERGGVTQTLRLIGIDTPEAIDPRKPVQCFGKEASNKAKELLVGKRVTLERDKSQGDLDKYQRALRYVYLEDGTFLTSR
ncbi:MAG: thermonuclease family protein [Candidatus Moraniibacteriota bacterium]